MLLVSEETNLPFTQFLTKLVSVYVEVTSTTSVSNTVTVLMSPCLELDGVLIGGTVGVGIGLVDKVGAVLIGYEVAGGWSIPGIPGIDLHGLHSDGMPGFGGEPLYCTAPK